MKLNDFKHLWEHAQDSPHEGTLDVVTHAFSAANPSCGDEISVELLVDKKGIIQDAAFGHVGCTLSYVAASAFLDYIVGKKFDAVKKIPEDRIFKLLKMNISEARKECATLVVETIKAVEIKEDEVFDALASGRDKKNAKFVSHKDAYA